MARILYLATNTASDTLVGIGDLADTLGLSDKKVKYIVSIAVAFDIITRKTFRMTHSGTLIYQHDCFFDDIGTLWWLHYSISSNPRHTVWSRLANQIVPENKCFTIDQICPLFIDLTGKYSEKSLSSHVNIEVTAFVQAYTQSNLSRLVYLTEADEQYRLGYREPLPPLVLAACIARYRDQYRQGDTALAVTDLLSAPNSPGVVCQIPEDRLRAGLEALKTQPGLSLESRADLDQVRLTDDIRDYQWMERYYASR